MVQSSDLCVTPSTQPVKFRPTYSHEIPDPSIFSKISNVELLNNTNTAFNTALCFIPPTLDWEPFQEMRQFLNDPVCEIVF